MSSGSLSRGILKIRFNQDYGCFTAAMEGGVRVFNVDPLAERGRIEYEVAGGVGHAEMMERSNLIALVAGGAGQKFSNRNVMVWDDLKRKFIFEIGFASPVISVRWRTDKLIVVLLVEIHIFFFPTSPEHTSPSPPSPHHLCTLSTSPNPRGLCEVCSSVECQIMAYPATQRGAVLIKDLMSLDSPGQAATERICHAHTHELSCMALNVRGSMMATASTKGTLIRIHSTSTRDLIAEFRRGSDTANMHCLSFNPDSSFLCCSSDKGTVHVFAVKDQSLNKKSSLAPVGLLGRAVASYMDSQWGVAHFSLPKEGLCICAFTGNRSVVALCLDGSYHKYTFKTDGNCLRDSYDVFLDVFDEQM